MFKIVAVLVCFCSYVIPANCQQARPTSGNAANTTFAQDTARINNLIKKAEQVQFADPGSAISIIQQAMQLAEKANYNYGIAAACNLRAGLFFYEMKLDSCSMLLNKAFPLVKDQQNNASKILSAAILNRFASIYQRRQNYDSAIDRYMQAATIFKNLNDNSGIINSYYNLSGIYRYIADTVKTFSYAHQAMQLAQKSKDTLLIIRANIALSNAYEFVGNYDSVLLLSKSGLSLAEDKKLIFAIGIYNKFIGLYFANKSNSFDSAAHHYKLSLSAFNKINLPYDIAMVLQHLGNLYLQQKDYKSVFAYSGKAKELSQKWGFDQVLYLSLKDLVQAAEETGDVNASNKYLKQFVAVNDSIQNKNNQKRVFMLESRNLKQQREFESASQQKIISAKNKLNYLLIGGLILLLLVILQLYLNYRNKQSLQKQRITELETQQQLTATEAVLKGEEQERTRLAKDLHDGLGGMLSGIKYSMKHMQGNLIMTAENEKAFARSIDMLDNSILEMRRLAHNMMPEALVKFGLDEALRDFCADINLSGALQINYQSIGIQNYNFNQTAAIAVYRIVQELINNVIKHAGAKQAIVQLSKTGNSVSLTVEDDGRGFNKASLEENEGMGWSNIYNRVDLLRGVLDVDTSAEKGTSVHIEFKI